MFQKDKIYFVSSGVAAIGAVTAAIVLWSKISTNDMRVLIWVALFVPAMMLAALGLLEREFISAYKRKEAKTREWWKLFLDKTGGNPSLADIMEWVHDPFVGRESVAMAEKLLQSNGIVHGREVLRDVISHSGFLPQIKAEAGRKLLENSQCTEDDALWLMEGIVPSLEEAARQKFLQLATPESILAKKKAWECKEKGQQERDCGFI